jgi:hypothetical protein
MRFRLHWVILFALAAWVLLVTGSLVAQSQPASSPPADQAPADQAKPQPKPAVKPAPAKKPVKKPAPPKAKPKPADTTPAQDSAPVETPRTEPPAPLPLLPLTPEEPPQPTLAQPEPAKPSLVQPAPMVSASSSKSSALPQALARPSAPDAALAPNAATDASLSRARPMASTDAHSSTPEASQATGPPPPLALPVVSSSPDQVSAGTAANAAPSLSQSAPVQPSLSQPGSGRAGSSSSSNGTRPAALSGRRLTFSQQPYDSPMQDAPYAVKVTMNARGTMHPASVVFQCNERVDHAGVPASDGRTFKQLRESYLNTEKTAYWLVFDEPALEPGDSFTIILMSVRPIRVVNVQEGPAVK